MTSSNKVAGKLVYPVGALRTVSFKYEFIKTGWEVLYPVLMVDWLCDVNNNCLDSFT